MQYFIGAYCHPSHWWFPALDNGYERLDGDVGTCRNHHGYGQTHVAIHMSNVSAPGADHCLAMVMFVVSPVLLCLAGGSHGLSQTTETSLQSCDPDVCIAHRNEH